MQSWHIWIWLILFPPVWVSTQAKPTGGIKVMFTYTKKVNPVDTPKKTWIATPPLDRSVSDSMAALLFETNEHFQDDWDMESLFSRNDYITNSLPDSIRIPLLQKDDSFFLTWYGTVSSEYGPRWEKMHHGLDLVLVTGDTVVSAFNGIVRYARYHPHGYGNCIIIRHQNGLETLYGHLSKIVVEPNQYVRAGETIGLGGSTGKSTGPHLHFETRYKHFSFNPFLFIDKETKTLMTDTLLLTKKEIIQNRNPLFGSIGATGTYTGTTSKKKKESLKKKNKDLLLAGLSHIVKKGENLSTIAKKYKVSIRHLIDINKLKKTAFLKPGQKIRIK